MIIAVSDDESNASLDSPGIFDYPNGSVADNDTGMTVRDPFAIREIIFDPTLVVPPRISSRYALSPRSINYPKSL
jgi:hypothetical protein